jgi:predicted NUDIX family NTP pyrophosphohydrolase
MATSHPKAARAEWFYVFQAREKINPSQAALIDELLVILGIADRG